MPSENKTPNIGLNQWEGNEYIKREDFVDDNALIDAAIQAAREEIHSMDERKADLQEGKVPASQLPEMDYLTPTGEGKDVTVTFTEAATEADIVSGEKISVMFGKILKKFKNIISGTTSVGKAVIASKLETARNINGVAFDGSVNITIADNTKAPIAHAVNANTYGLGTNALHGHVKLSDALDSTYGVTSGIAATPNAVKLTNDKLKYTVVTITASGNWTVPAGVNTIDVLIIDGGDGGGGGGAGTKSNEYNNYPGSGGFGGKSGKIYTGRFSVTPNQQIGIVIGAGGIGSAGSTNGTSATIGGLGGVTQILNILCAYVGEVLASKNGNSPTDGNGNGLSGEEKRLWFKDLLYISSGGNGGNGGHTSSGGLKLPGNGGNGGNGAGNGGNGGARGGGVGQPGIAATIYGCGGGGGGGAGGWDNSGYVNNTVARGGNGKQGVVYIGYYGF